MVRCYLQKQITPRYVAFPVFYNASLSFKTYNSQVYFFFFFYMSTFLTALSLPLVYGFSVPVDLQPVLNLVHKVSMSPSFSGILSCFCLKVNFGLTFLVPRKIHLGFQLIRSSLTYPNNIHWVPAMGQVLRRQKQLKPRNYGLGSL